MTERWLWLTVKPRWAEVILDGSKTLEIRRRCPTAPLPIKCLVYGARKGLMGECIILSAFGIEDWWADSSPEHDILRQANIGRPQYHRYLEGASNPTALRVIEPRAWDRVVSAREIREVLGDGWCVPQSWRYLSGTQGRLLRDRGSEGMLRPSPVAALLRDASSSPGQGAPAAAPLESPAARGHPATPKIEPGCACFTR